MTDWCILRTSGPSTLRLANSLAAAGFDVWTPVEVQRRRKPRTTAKQEITLAIMPTFVFARSSHLADLLNVSTSPVSPHAGFSIFRHNNNFPLIADQHLNPLRLAERRATPRDLATVFNPGELVKLTEGGFVGMTGTVQEARGQWSMVLFPGFTIPIKIESALLHVDKAA